MSHYWTWQCTGSRVLLLLPQISVEARVKLLDLSWETKSGKSLWPSPCIIGPQEGKSPLLNTCKKHYSPEITCTRSGPRLQEPRFGFRIFIILFQRSFSHFCQNKFFLSSSWFWGAAFNLFFLLAAQFYFSEPRWRRSCSGEEPAVISGGWQLRWAMKRLVCPQSDVAGWLAGCNKVDGSMWCQRQIQALEHCKHQGSGIRSQLSSWCLMVGLKQFLNALSI